MTSENNNHDSLTLMCLNYMFLKKEACWKNIQSIPMSSTSRTDKQTFQEKWPEETGKDKWSDGKK